MKKLFTVMLTLGLFATSISAQLDEETKKNLNTLVAPINTLVINALVGLIKKPLS